MVGKYKDENTYHCTCKENIPLEGWGRVKKTIDGFICHKCGEEVEDNKYNYNILSSTEEIMCPKCQIFIGNEDLEILNELHDNFEHDLFDHRKYFPKEHKITGEPYHCNGEAMAELLRLGKKLGYKVFLVGSSEHDNSCFTIAVTKIKNKQKKDVKT